MTHRMKLRSVPFEQIRSGTKTIELRLNDAKRQSIEVGDTILFSLDQDPAQTLFAQVVRLHRFSDFAQLYRTLPLEKCGYAAHQLSAASPQDMLTYYSAEQQAQYGVVGIEIRLNKNTVDG